MKKIKKLLISILLVIFLSQSSACFLLFNQNVVDGPHMSERVYQRIDESAVDNCLQELNLLLTQDGKQEQVIEKRNQFFNDYYTKAFTMNTIASINYDKDVTNEYWQEESVLATNIAQKIQNDAIKLEQAILTSEFYGEFFRKELGEEYADSILKTETDSEEQLAILEQISSLEASYSLLYSTGDYTTLTKNYIELVNLRNEYARSKKNAEGNPYNNYLEYAYAQVYGREYTPNEVQTFRTAIRANLLSIRNDYLNESQNVNYYADEALSESKVKKIMPEIIKNTVPDMLDSWEYMMERELYDFAVSNKKANTSYVTSFYEYGDAYMFINASGSILSDLSTFIHEFGHYNEHFMSDKNLTDDNLMSYDLAETHSQAFELITLDAVKNVLAKNTTTKNLYQSYVFNLMINSIWSMLSNCIFDEFEYAVYNANSQDLSASYLNNLFSYIWNKYWSVSGYKFYDIPHLFLYPGYCISYTVSMVFSFEIWASDNPVNNYVEVVKYGTGNTLSNVYTNVNLPNPLSENTVTSIAEKLSTFTFDTFGW